MVAMRFTDPTPQASRARLVAAATNSLHRLFHLSPCPSRSPQPDCGQRCSPTHPDNQHEVTCSKVKPKMPRVFFREFPTIWLRACFNDAVVSRLVLFQQECATLCEHIFPVKESCSCCVSLCRISHGLDGMVVRHAVHQRPLGNLVRPRHISQPAVTGRLSGCPSR